MAISSLAMSLRSLQRTWEERDDQAENNARAQVALNGSRARFPDRLDLSCERASLSRGLWASEGLLVIAVSLARDCAAARFRTRPRVRRKALAARLVP